MGGDGDERRIRRGGERKNKRRRRNGDVDNRKGELSAICLWKKEEEKGRLLQEKRCVIFGRGEGLSYEFFVSLTLPLGNV